MRAQIVVLMAGLLITSQGLALDIEGVKLPDKASVGGSDLVLNGAGVRKRAIFKLYVGSLYLPAKASSASDVLAKVPRRIQLDMLRNLSSDQLIGALMEGLKQNSSAAEMQAITVQTGELAAIMKSFGEAKEGSVVALDFAGNATTISLDGTPRGSVEGVAFNDALTRIWIGDHPVQADLKKAMLGGA